MAKIIHGKSLRDLDTNKEYLVYYTGKYSETGQAISHNCDGFGKIKHRWNDNNWTTSLYARGSSSNISTTVIVTSINTSFIIEL